MSIRRITLSIFFIIQIIALILFFSNKQYDYLYETVIILGCILFIACVSYRYKLLIPNYVVVIVLLSLSAHIIGGQLFNLYVKSNTFDKYLHIFGTYSFAILGYFYLRIYDITLTKRKRLIITIMIGISLATIYELMEFTIDYFIKPAVPAQSGLLDTNLDLLADLFGAVLAGVFIQKSTKH